MNGNDEKSNQVRDGEDTAVEEKINLENQFKAGANWFYWIAGLSVVNTIIVLANREWSFIVGLGITQVIDAIAYVSSGEIGGMNAYSMLALTLDFAVAAVFVMFGLYARKMERWAFLAGMILYGLDGLIFLYVSDYLSFAFHLFALWALWGGLKACRTLIAEFSQPIVENVPTG